MHTYIHLHPVLLVRSSVAITLTFTTIQIALEYTAVKDKAMTMNDLTKRKDVD